jgi:hypothetical protein
MAGAHVLPADITVLAGRFGPFPSAQPLVFAHLAEIAPDLDLGHVEVIPVEGGARRLGGYFEDALVAHLHGAAGEADTLVLILPGAYPGLYPPPLASDRLAVLGDFRGQVTRSFGGGA